MLYDHWPQILVVFANGFISFAGLGEKKGEMNS